VARRGALRAALRLDDFVDALGARFRRSHLLFQFRLLLAGNRPPRALLGLRVGVGALAAHRQILLVPRAAVGPDVHHALDVHRDFGAQRALDLVIALDHLAQARDFGIAQVPHPRVGAHARLLEDLFRVAAPDPVDVREGEKHFLLTRQVDAGDPRHALALPLLVFGAALADHPDHTAALDHLAVLADRSNAGTNLQRSVSTKKVQFSLRVYPGP